MVRCAIFTPRLQNTCLCAILIKAFFLDWYSECHGPNTMHKWFGQDNFWSFFFFTSWCWDVLEEIGMANSRLNVANELSPNTSFFFFAGECRENERIAVVLNLHGSSMRAARLRSHFIRTARELEWTTVPVSCRTMTLFSEKKSTWLNLMKLLDCGQATFE